MRKGSAESANLNDENFNLTKHPILHFSFIILHPNAILFHIVGGYRSIILPESCADSGNVVGAFYPRFLSSHRAIALNLGLISPTTWPWPENTHRVFFLRPVPLLGLFLNPNPLLKRNGKH